MRYSIVTDDISKQYFYINPDTGVISLRRVLTDNNIGRFSVSEHHKLRSSTGITCNNFYVLLIVTRL